MNISTIAVDLSSTQEVIRERDPEDEWDRGSTRTEWTVNGIRLAQPRDYDTVDIEGEVNPGDVLHLLYVIYSTGDSFGHDECARLEIISCHRDRLIAESNLRIIEHSRTRSDDYHLQLFLQGDSGISWKYSPPWTGYFESLDGVYLDTFTVG